MDNGVHKAYKPSHDYNGTNGTTVIESAFLLRLWPLLSGNCMLDALERRIGRTLDANARRLASWPWALAMEEGD